jgi:predicted anti-sigma-YlaC factor YlaD
MTQSPVEVAPSLMETAAVRERDRHDSRPVRVAKLALFALALTAVGVALLNGLIASIGESPQFCFTLAGSFAIHLAIGLSRRELAVTVSLGVALRVAYGATYGIKPYFGSEWIVLGAFLGVASLAVLAVARRKRTAGFGAAAFFPLVSILVGFVLPVTNRLSPLTFDTHLLAADGALGLQPSFLAGRLIAGRPALRDLTSTVYHALPLAVALLCAAQIRRRPEEVRRLFWLLGSTCVAGFCLYSVCPATGPAYAFPESYPFGSPTPHEASPRLLPVPGAPRNAIPSLHFSTALLIFWNARRLRRSARMAAALFLAATTFAILALGEHYLVDAVAALPFSLFFHAAFCGTPAPSPWRYRAMAAGAASVVLWLAILRFGPHYLAAWPIAISAAFVATAAFTIIGEHELRHTPAAPQG